MVTLSVTQRSADKSGSLVSQSVRLAGFQLSPLTIRFLACVKNLPANSFLNYRRRWQSCGFRATDGG